MSGQRLGGIVPYGYIKDETGQLVIDEETAPIVKLIFQLCVEGNGTGKIARILKEREIPTPGTIIFQRTGRAGRYHPDNPCLWRGETISGILAQDAYLGQTTNFKYSKPSFKSKKIARNPPEKRIGGMRTRPPSKPRRRLCSGSSRSPPSPIPWDTRK
ncbi:recombinase family protein [uncultured Oscillibacter sp.]|uniref:recombinase family protein n=1 Tax=uncultured Oscillibacter sp. TaxID=876091 RepID=UPI003427C07D